MNPIRKIVFGTDFSEISDRALAGVVELARTLGASLDLVHVYAMPALTLPIEGALISTPGQLARLTDRMQAALDERIARHRGSGVPMQGHLRMGRAPDELAAVARELGAELIAVGTHGRTGAAHALLGSVAERVVRHADRPVLTMRVG